MRGLATVEIPLDQFEAMHLCDVEGLDQEEAGSKMGVSRGTVQRLLYEGRRRLLEAIVDNSAITVNLRESEDRDVSVCSGGR